MKQGILLTVVVLLFGTAKELTAQTALWTNTFPVPADYLCDLYPRDNESPSYPYQYSAADGVGGSVWILNLFPQEASTNFVRILWVNNKGVSIFTNDVVHPFAPVESFVDIAITRFTTKELALQLRTYSVDPDPKTNVLRRIKKVSGGFSVIDTPLSANETLTLETRATTDKLGFFSNELLPSIDGEAGTAFYIRRYSNK